MLPSKSTVLQVAIVLTVFCGRAHAQTPNQYPGYKFEAKKISFLKGYKVTYDALTLRTNSIRGTHRTLSIRKGKTFILLRIHVAQSKKLSSKDIVNNIAYHPRMSVISQYVKNDAKVVGIGDTVYTFSRNSAAKVITSPIVFARKNVVIHIEEVSGAKNLDLRPLAEQIDADIKRMKLVNEQEFEKYRPQIDELTLQKTVLKSSEETELTVKISDPNKRSFKRYFQSVGSVRKKNGKEYLVAPLGPHKGELKVIVISDHLLYCEKTVKFTVLK